MAQGRQRPPGKTGPGLLIAQSTLADRGVYTAVAFSTVQTGPASTAVSSTVSTGARLVVVAPTTSVAAVATPLDPGPVAPVAVAPAE